MPTSCILLIVTSSLSWPPWSIGTNQTVDKVNQEKPIKWWGLWRKQMIQLKKVPELRFKGFTDEWEQRKLGDEVRIVMGQSPNSENYTDDPNGR